MYNIFYQFVEQFALDLPKFLQASSKEKAAVLLQIIGVGDQLTVLERQEAEAYNKRHAIGQIADQKKKYSEEMAHYPDAPTDLVSPSGLIRQQQDILARNGENQRKRQRKAQLEQQVQTVRQQLDELKNRFNALLADYEIACQSAKNLLDESTAALEASIAEAEETNRRVRANLDKQKAQEDAEEFHGQYNRLWDEIEGLRQQKTELLNGANLPLPDLSVEGGELLYHGQKWDGMSGSEQLKVATAIVRRLNPDCGFVLMDRLEQMDIDTLREFGAWLETEGLQVIATRVSTGGECSVVIEDGLVAESATSDTKKWEVGQF